MTSNSSNNKKFKESIKSPKSGSSNSKLDFIKEGTDFLTEIENEEDDSELIMPEDLDDPELAEFDEEVDQEYAVGEEISEEEKEVKPGKVTVISRKVPVKKPVENEAVENEAVEKEVNELVKELITDVSETEVTNFLESISRHGDQLLNGEMQFLGRNNASSEDKKEFITKLDEITTSDEISKANSAFVLNWLKNRNNT